MPCWARVTGGLDAPVLGDPHIRGAVLGTGGLDAPVLGDPRILGAARLPTLAAAASAVGNGCEGLSGAAVLHARACAAVLHVGRPRGRCAGRPRGHVGSPQEGIVLIEHGRAAHLPSQALSTALRS